jgi:hypothetical protein
MELHAIVVGIDDVGSPSVVRVVLYELESTL